MVVAPALLAVARADGVDPSVARAEVDDTVRDGGRRLDRPPVIPEFRRIQLRPLGIERPPHGSVLEPQRVKPPLDGAGENESVRNRRRRSDSLADVGAPDRLPRFFVERADAAIARAENHYAVPGEDGRGDVVVARFMSP